jgi:uncharacterized protein YkwD
MLMLMNSARGDHPLSAAPDLTSRAQSRAEYFCDHALSHDGWQAYFAGTPYTVMGENLAKGYSDVYAAEAALMQSPGHRGNILNPEYKHLGVGEACGVIVQFFSD